MLDFGYFGLSYVFFHRFRLSYVLFAVFEPWEVEKHLVLIKITYLYRVELNLNVTLTVLLSEKRG